MDLRLIETGNGGDFVKTKTDLQIIDGFQNMIYLAMFGGNVEESTPVVRPEGVQAFDWWGNKLFFEETPNLQFNSLTERALDNNALNSFGITQIEEAIINDLKFMQEFGKVSVDIELASDDKLIITIFIDQLSNLANKAFVFIWDATNRELIDDTITEKLIQPVQKIFDDTFDDSFA